MKLARLLPILLATPLVAKEYPWFRDFVGVCGHTVQFKPDLYAPVASQVRDYHPVEWDLAKETDHLPPWPFAENKVSWETVYGSWAKRGFTTNVCLNVDAMGKIWKNMEKDARAYGKSFAENFGPGGKWPFVQAVEIGNEPGLYDDATFLKLFTAMAEGLREGNPKLKIVTCNAEPGKSDRYWKSIDLFKPIPQLFDVIQIHRYAIAEGWPVWRRSFPEDPKTPFLSTIAELLKWRDAHAPQKPVWVTEFGWDSSTKKPDPKGEWAKWIGSTDEEQAKYLVRAFFLLAEMRVEKAFVYFFNDEDQPSLHAASGLTRNFQPKPAYHAVAWMLRHLKNYRFHHAEMKSLEGGYAFAFEPETVGQPMIWALWQAQESKKTNISVPVLGTKVLRAEQMPLAADTPCEVTGFRIQAQKLLGSTGEKPVLVWVERKIEP